MLPLASAALTGCFIDDHHDGGDDDGGGDFGTCSSNTPTGMEIDHGASVSYAVGVDAGYYATYAAGGHWHVEWTCDTQLSGDGCNFTGSATYDTATGGAAPSCFQCESNDIFTPTQQGAQTRIDFDTITSDGIDGIDFDAIPGHPVTLDLEINGLPQNDLVFIPSDGRTASPACLPLSLTPDSP